MLWNSGAIFFHRDQLLTWVHAIRWNPPFGAIHLTDSRPVFEVLENDYETEQNDFPYCYPAAFFRLRF